MVGVLIRMKLAALRHSMTGEQSAWAITGGTIGTILAVATVGLALDGRPVSVDLLGVVLAMWMIGWLVAPVLVGGQSVLRAEHFALLPVSRYRLAIGLLGAAFVGVTAVVTFLAFTSLLVYGMRLGAAPALVAVPAVALQLTFVVVLSRVAVGVFGAVMRSRAGAALSAVLLAGMLVAAQSGWMVYVGLEVSGVLSTGLPPAFSAAVRSLPSGWGLVAVGAAHRSDWLLVARSLTGLAVTIVLLLAVWSRLLASPRTARVVIRGPRGVRGTHGRRLLPARDAPVLAKELRTWWRSPWRTSGVVMPVAWALMTCLLPMTFGSTALLPWAAAGVVVMGAAGCANSYAEDGTALWMTLTIPGAERRDVRGRQWAWLMVFGPLTVVIAIVLTGLSGMDRAWPWVLAVVPALLGGGAGLSVWASVVALAPGPDPQRRRDAPIDHGDTGGMAIVVFWLALLPAVPPALVVLAGVLRDDPVVQWSGVAVGIATGVFLAWWLGRVASRRLEARGPELLALMRAGRPSGGARSVKVKPGVIDTMPRWRRLYVTILGPMLGSIALFPQGIVPLAMKLTDNVERVWFLALYLPDAWQWPVIVVMVTLGLLMYAIVLRMYLSQKRALNEAAG